MQPLCIYEKRLEHIRGVQACQKNCHYASNHHPRLKSRLSYRQRIPADYAYRSTHGLQASQSLQFTSRTWSHFKDHLSLPLPIQKPKREERLSPPFRTPRNASRSQIGSQLDSPALLTTQGGPAPAVLSDVLDPHHLGSVRGAGIIPGVTIVDHPRGQFSHLPFSLRHTVISPPSWPKTQARKLSIPHGNVKRNLSASTVCSKSWAISSLKGWLNERARCVHELLVRERIAVPCQSTTPIRSQKSEQGDQGGDNFRKWRASRLADGADDCIEMSGGSAAAATQNAHSRSQ